MRMNRDENPVNRSASGESSYHHPSHLQHTHSVASSGLDVAIKPTSSTDSVVDDRKPPSVLHLSTSAISGGAFGGDGTHPPERMSPKSFDQRSPQTSDKDLVKRKRRSPEKPWKKPKDMPKRPLSAYNLFFRDERERLLTSSMNKGNKNVENEKSAEAESSNDVKKGVKRSKKTSGIGFANLAKTIAAKWKELEDDIKAPYEKVAAAEKKVYDEAVAEWRAKQKVIKKALAAEKKIADESRMVVLRDQPPPASNLFSSERSLGSFSDSSNPYPAEWFHTTGGSGLDRSGRSDRGIPPVVDASLSRSSRRASGRDITGWSSGRHEAYYYQHCPTPEQQVQYHHQYVHQSRDYYNSGGRHSGNLNPNLFDYDTPPVSSSTQQAAAYEEYYQGCSEYYGQQPYIDPVTATTHYQHQQYRQHCEMRVDHVHHDYEQQQSYGSSSDATHLAVPSTLAYHHPVETTYPTLRTASHRGNEVGQARRTSDAAEVLIESFRSHSGGSSGSAFVATQTPMQGGEIDRVQTGGVDLSSREDSVNPLSDTLDEEGISFLSSLKYS